MDGVGVLGWFEKRSEVEKLNGGMPKPNAC
jgi:hypothetical protein